MDKSVNFPTAEEFEHQVVDLNAHKKKVLKEFKQNAGIFISCLLIFAVVVLVTTDIRLATWQELITLGIDFFLLLFISYSAYVNCADSGMRLALKGELYTKGLASFEKTKQYIIDNRMQARLGEFCNHYVTKELKNIRTAVVAVVGMSYDEYEKLYLGLDKEAVRQKGLSKAKERAIIKANRIGTIRLTPEMIMRRRKSSNRRSPLGMDPETRKGIVFGEKFVFITALSLALSIIAVDAIKAPSLVLFASLVLKLIAVIVNGFSGYKFGYENIAVDTVDYMADQEDLMHQHILYIEEHPLSDENEIIQMSVIQNSDNETKKEAGT